jgi:sec-independent protein translocase protein TatA
MIGNIGIGEMMVIFLVIMLFFGAKRLPELARSMGKSIAAFRQGVQGATDDIKKELNKPENLG